MLLYFKVSTHLNHFSLLMRDILVVNKYIVNKTYLFNRVIPSFFLGGYTYMTLWGYSWEGL
jgi:hypothetical protein